MSSNHRNSLFHLVRWVRNRLWLESMIKGINLSLWFSAVLLIGMGFVHLYIWSIKIQFAAAMALIPSLLALIYSLLQQRPSMSSASITADHWVDGKSLLVSAWDLFDHPSENQTTASLIMHQAKGKRSIWWKRLNSLPRLGFPRSSAIAMAIFLISLILLLLPGRSETAFRHTPTERDLPVVTSVQNPLADVIETLSASSLNSALDRTAARHQTDDASAETRRSSQNNRGAADNSQRDNPVIATSAWEQQTPPSAIASDGIDSDPTANNPRLQATPSRNGKQKGGRDSAGNSKDPVGEQKRIDVIPALSLEPITVKRITSDDHGSTDTSITGVELAGLNEVEVKPSAQEPLPVAGSARNIPYLTSFDPVERRVISDYFQRLKTRPIQ